MSEQNPTSVYAEPSEEEVRACEALGLFEAIKDGDIDRLRDILFVKENAAVRDRDGEIPMHAAAWRSYPEELRVLIEAYPNGAKVKDENGLIPLHQAADMSFEWKEDDEGLAESKECIRLLIDAYPDGPKVRNNCGEIALHYAAPSDRVDIVIQLLDAYVDGAKVTDNGGYLPLHQAADYGNVDVVTVLLEAYPEGATARNEEGLLPIHSAMRGNYRFDQTKPHMQCVMMILQASGYAGLFEAVEK